GSSLTAGGMGLAMREGLGEEMRQTLRPDGVDAVFGVRFRRIDYNNRIVLLLGLDLAALDAAPDCVLARNLARYPRLRERGTALVSENFAALHGVHPGQELVIHGKDGLLRLQGLGTAVDYTWNRGTILIDRGWDRQGFEGDPVGVFGLFVHPRSHPNQGGTA